MKNIESAEAALPRILVVDDTPANLQVVGEILSRNIDCDLAFATDGQQALDSVRDVAPDLVLLDVMMPGMDGFAVCRTLKEDADTADVPVLFLTAKVESSDIVTGFSAGAVDYITKPFNPAELIARVRTQLRIRQDAARLAAQTEELNENVERLAASENFLRTVIQSLPYPFAVIDAQTRQITMANAGFGGENSVGKHCDEVLSCHSDGDLEAEENCPLGMVLESKQPVSISRRMTDDQGKIQHIEVHGYPVLDQSGNVVQMIESRFDVTDRVESESRIRELEKSESLGRMAGAVAHHYNNMMAVVIGNLELMILDAEPGSDVVTEINEALRAAKRAADMGGLMLAYLGQTRAPRQRMDVLSVLRDEQQRVREDVPDSVELEWTLPDYPLIIQGNEGQLEQSLNAMLTNAREALVDNRGRISVVVKQVDAAAIGVGQRFPATFQPGSGPYLCIEIQDTGQGIPEENVSRLFDPFFSTKFPGRGLGLAVMLSAIKAHEGCVTIASELGQGTTMRLFLPLLVEAASESEKPLAAEVPTREREGEVTPGTVLLAEDEESVRSMQAQMLKRLGWTVLEAADGRLALDLFQQQPDEIDLVLCDLTMPGLDGWGLIDGVRSVRPGLPVILASGYDQVSALAGEHDEKPQAFLHKPYQIATLREALAKAMAK